MTEAVSRRSADQTWSDATLRVFSADTSADEISKQLGIEPTRFRVKGEFKSSYRPESIWKEHGWLLRSDRFVDRSLPLDQHLRWIADVVLRKRRELHSLMQICDIDLRSSIIMPEGSRTAIIRIAHETLRTLTTLPLSLIVALYTPEPDNALVEVADGTTENDRKYVFLALRVSSTSIRVSEISEALGAHPTQTRDQPTAFWLLDSGVDSAAPIEQHFGVMSRFIYQNHLALRGLAASCRIELVCNYASDNGQGGPYIRKTWLRYLASAPVDLVINLFAPEDVEPVSP